MSARIDTLPFHLGLAMSLWWSSSAVSQLAKSGWHYWSPPLPTSSKSRIAPDLRRWSELLASDPALQKAVEKEAHQRVVKLLQGVEAYQSHPYRRTLIDPPSRWRRGNARLLDYGSWKSDKPAILFIPSLINRYYVLDLEEGRSLTRHLADEGYHPFILDWGTPGKPETGFGCTQYVTEYLIEALEEVHARTRQPVILVGYCMGGLLAMAATQLRPELVRSLALLATPWDFHSDDFRTIPLDHQSLKQLRSIIDSQETLPDHVIQILFYLINPWVFQAKFRQFADMDKQSDAAQNFMALERWVNDGVPMTRRMAKECLIDWAQYNTPAKGEWRVAGVPINPEKIECPTFIAAPLNDQIVPLNCAMPLATLIDDATVVNPPSGHVSMLVGSSAQKELWTPLERWLQQF